MNYQFPIIKRIEDVLPAIEGRDEFIVAEREGYKVINYNVGFEDTFTIDENDLMENHGEMIPKGIMRRECRGIIFDDNGKIMSRPFHKFFNVGERDETQLHNLDLTAPHVIMEKMDGSMIRPLRVGGLIRLGTKMGLTDTAAQAEEYLMSRADHADIMIFIERLMDFGMTPLFEFVSPENRIVIEYKEADLVLLGIRDNVSGNYLVPQHATPKTLTQVPRYGSVDGSFEDYIARQRGREGREGDIVRFDSGHMLKIKNDWYVRIHKVKDKIRSDRHILALLLENELDDLYPHLDENDFARVKAYEADFHEKFRAAINYWTVLAETSVKLAGGDKKRLAVEILPNSGLPKGYWQFIFKYADGVSIRSLMDRHVRAKLGNTAKYNELAEFLGLTASAENEELEE